MKKAILAGLLSIPCAVMAQNTYQSLDSYWYAPDKNNFKEIVTASNQVNRPNDLDFNPLETNGPMELWVICEGLENTGGWTITVLNAGESNQQSIYKKDGNSWHFMALPTGMAFGDAGDWGSSPGIYDANRSGGTPFTGPSLWSGDLTIYAITPPGGNGSHLDMLHQSPLSMGIAHDYANVYWVFDGFHSTLVRYDFAADHGPGNSDHSDGMVHFYKEVTLSRDNNGIPGHMVLDKENNMLYICDTGNDRIVRVDISTGTKKQDMPFFQEPLAQRWEMQGVTWGEVVTGLSRPCGIDVYGERMVVTDNETGEIIFYDLSSDPIAELGRIPVPYSNPDIRGIKVGPRGRIWFTDYTQNKVYMIDHPSVFPLSINELSKVKLNLYPNPVSNILQIQGLDRDEYISMKVYDNNGRQVLTNLPESLGTKLAGLDVSSLPSGLYLISVQTKNGQSVQQKFIRE